MPDTYLLQCSKCGAQNRAAHESAAGRRRCEECGAPLIPSNVLPVQVSDRDWDALILGSSVPTVVEVWSPECGVCAQYDVSVRHMAVRLFGRARVLQINIEENPATAERYGIQGVPTVLLFREGKLLHKLNGPQGEKGIREKLGV